MQTPRPSQQALYAPRMILALTRRCIPIVSLSLTMVACANSSGAPTGPGSGGNSGDTSGASGTVNLNPGNQSGNSPNPNLEPMGDASGTASNCQQFDVTFTPRIPLVYVLADSSGSMFDQNTLADGGRSDDWVPLRAATLGVIQTLQSQVDFGFGDYGSNGSASMYTAADYSSHMCGLLNNVPIAPNNFMAISTLYGSLADMQPYGKTNTPAQLALGQAATHLMDAAQSLGDGGVAAGGMYILLVTDGETDFCDDGAALCPLDAVAGEIQSLYTQGIHTLVLGLPSTESSLAPQALQAFANAGVGVPVKGVLQNPGDTTPLSPQTINQQCVGSVGWENLFKASGRGTTEALATYAAAGDTITNAPLYSPGVADVASLTNQISAALQTVKSCSFDLQGHIEVNLADAGAGHVSIDGVALSYSADGGADGWTMSSSTELDLVGAACQTWRTTGKNIAFNFPCNVLINVPR